MYIRSVYIVITCSVLLAACGRLSTNAPPTSTISPTDAAQLFPTPIATDTRIPAASATPRVFESRWYELIKPVAGDSLSSPISFEGSTNLTPESGAVWMGVYDEHWKLLSELEVPIEGDIGAPGTFKGKISFSGYSGPGHLGLAEESKGEPLYIADVTLQP